MVKSKADASKSESTTNAVSKEKGTAQVREYAGTMEIGMAIMTSMVIAEVIISSFWVFLDCENLIFPDRVAPKFIFDIARAFITLGFSVFWM